MNAVQNVMAKVQDDMAGKLSVGEGSTQPERAAVGEDAKTGSRTDPSNSTMKAVVWLGSRKVACVEGVPRPRLTHPGDAIVRVTYCSICSGSDSHLYSGEIPTMDEGFTLGHEACGVVDEVGDAVKTLHVGDRVVIAFSVACGTCDFCQRGEFTGCDSTNDSKLFEQMYGGGRPAGAIFGYSRLVGNIPGSQAEYVRVPFGDVNCLRIPDSVPDEKALFISDVLATALHATELGEVREGDTVVIWGLGPIGLYAAEWSKFKKAKRVIGIDMVPARLTLARDSFGIEVLNRTGMTSDQVVSTLSSLLPPVGGADVVIDATGFRFSESWTDKLQRATGMETDTPEVLRECLMVVRKYGRVSVIADYLGTTNRFPIGHIMMKHLTLRSGQCPVQKYWKFIMETLERGEIDPLLMVTHRLNGLEEMPEAYDKLFNKTDGCIKVLVNVGGSTGKKEAEP